MAGGADDERFPVFGSKRGHRWRHRVMAEINHHIALTNDGGQVVAITNLGGDFQLTKLPGAGDQRLTHPAFRTNDDNLGHRTMKIFARRPWTSPGPMPNGLIRAFGSGFAYSRTSHRFNVVRRTSQFFGFIGTSGRRYSSSINFIMASAAFTGVGLVSMKRSLNSG
jgi:hypothetical protein